MEEQLPPPDPARVGKTAAPVAAATGAPRRERPYVIEAGVPLPVPLPRGDRFPLSTMKPGDSFAIATLYEARQVRQDIVEKNKADGSKFTVRKLAGGTWRCWRTV